MSERNSSLIADTCTQRIAGLREHVSAKTDIVLDTKHHKLADVVAVYQTSLETRAQLLSKRNEVKVALAAYRNAETTRRKTEKLLARWVLTHLGEDTEAAHDIGFAPRKPGQASVVTKANALLQSAATREARHTMGKKQKLQIKGAPPAPSPPETSGPPARVEGPPTGAPVAEPGPSPTNGGSPPTSSNVNGVAH